jgi:branched-chain amino acid transport system permease protein
VGGLLLGVAQTLIAGYGNAAYQTQVALILMLAVMIARTLSPTARRHMVREEPA